MDRENDLLEQSVNREDISLTFLVFHLDISGKSNKELQP